MKKRQRKRAEWREAHKSAPISAFLANVICVCECECCVCVFVCVYWVCVEWTRGGRKETLAHTHNWVHSHKHRQRGESKEARRFLISIAYDSQSVSVSHTQTHTQSLSKYTYTHTNTKVCLHYKNFSLCLLVWQVKNCRHLISFHIVFPFATFFPYFYCFLWLLTLFTCFLSRVTFNLTLFCGQHCCCCCFCYSHTFSITKTCAVK